MHKLTQEYINAENKTENLPLVWKELGPISYPNNKCMNTVDYNRIKGPGRCSFVEFDRLNNQRIFTGSPTGGLFYSTNGGNNWKNGGTDYLPTPGISHFQIDSPSNTWFIATGDADAGFTASYGIFRSTNEGTNWYPINNGLEILNPITNWWANQCSKILINPINGNIMYGVFFTGIFKTTNALATNPYDVIWTKVCDGKFTDIQYKPNSNFQELYASGSSIYYSTNAGDNWNTIPNIQQLTIAPTDIVVIRVTKSNLNALYAAVVHNVDNDPSTALLYKYNTSSQTWSNGLPMSGDKGLIQGRSQSFAVSNTDENLIFKSQINPIYRSTNGGINWLALSNDKHDDSHWITFNPDGDALWIATDGGVYKSTNLGATWENKTNNIGVSNMFNIATGNTLFNQILYGGYDTGTSLFDGNNWTQMNKFGDSFDCLIDDTDPQNPIYYMTTQYTFSRSDDGACIFNQIFIPSEIKMHGWEHRMVKDFHTQSTIYYAGEKRIGRTTNKGNSWSAISFDAQEGGYINRLFYALWNSSNYPNYLYILRVNPKWEENDLDAFRLFKSTNCNELNSANVTWSNATPVLNGQTIHKWIGDVSIDEENPDKIWVCYGGFHNDVGTKVMYFNGSTWEDMTGGYDNNSPLYGISACKIILQRNSDIVYLATTAGLYYKTNITNWTPLSGVPHCEVWDMDMNYFGNKLRIATRGRGLWETDIPCIYNSTPLEITSNQLWDIDKRLSSNVIIKNNATLTITSRISAPTDAKIIVEPGGKLIVDGGTLTNGCAGDFWQGIEVQGNPNQMQNDPQYQGYVELKNGATIENAVIGVHCVLNAYTPADNGGAPPYASYSSGGIVIANGAIFRNNETSINIEHYPFGNYYSSISNCTFEHPKEILPVNNGVSYVILTEVKGVNIYQNNFNGDTKNVFDLRGIGIEAHDATFNLINNLGAPAPNVFTNLSYGVACYNTSAFAKPEIVLGEFTDCWRAIYLSGVADAKVINNTINYKSQSTDANSKAYGIYLDNCNGYQVEGNLLSSSSKVMSEYPENGIVVNNSGANTNQIYRNTFTKIQVPINAQNINRLPDGSIGLQLLCNTITECTVNDMVLTYDASQPNPNLCGIKMNQGWYLNDPKVPAGNLFTKGNKTYKNYINTTPNMVYYAHYANDDVTYQGNPHYLIPRIVAVNSNMSNQNTNILWYTSRWDSIDCRNNTGIQFGKGKSTEGITALKDQIELLQPKIDSANTALFLKMDHGNTTTLINRITTAAPSNYQMLYNDLRNYSPYLSEEVLLALIHKQGFPTNMLVNLMLVNTHVAKTPLLMDALQQKQPPLPSGQIKQIANKIKVFSVMEIDRMKISNMLTQRDYAYNTVESYYAHDSLVCSYDSLGAMLQRDPRLSAKYDLVYHYLANDDSIHADLLANQIPQMFLLDAQAQVEYNHYKQLYELKRNLQREGKNLMDMSEAQQQMLINAINNPSMSTGEMSNLNALRQVAGMLVGNNKAKSLTISYKEPILDPIENKEKDFGNTDVTGNEELLMEVLLDKVLMEQNNLQLFPNPASNMVNVLYNLSSDAEKVSIEINDVTGKVISTYMVDKNSSQMIINTQHLSKGIYYVILLVGDKRQKVEKLVIQ